MLKVGIVLLQNETHKEITTTRTTGICPAGPLSPSVPQRASVPTAVGGTDVHHQLHNCGKILIFQTPSGNWAHTLQKFVCFQALVSGQAVNTETDTSKIYSSTTNVIAVVILSLLVISVSICMV